MKRWQTSAPATTRALDRAERAVVNRREPPSVAARLYSFSSGLKWIGHVPSRAARSNQPQSQNGRSSRGIEAMHRKSIPLQPRFDHPLQHFQINISQLIDVKSSPYPLYAYPAFQVRRHVHPDNCRSTTTGSFCAGRSQSASSQPRVPLRRFLCLLIPKPTKEVLHSTGSSLLAFFIISSSTKLSSRFCSEG